jgi:hypothetical protein
MSPSTSKEKNNVSEHKRIGRNIGRIELLAVQGKVNTFLEAGYDRKKIHCRLVEEGAITMSYPAFCYQLKQLLNRGTPASPQNAARQPKTSAPSRINQSEPFTIDRNPKLETFV